MPTPLMPPTPGPGHVRQPLACLLAAYALTLVSPTRAAATWSIVAVDPKTQEVGSAGASCTRFVAGIVGLAPGHGVIVAQAASNAEAREKGVAMLMAGSSPAQVVAAVATAAFDADFEEQQYGVAALGFDETVAAFTGARTHPAQRHVLGRGVAVQGNILTNADVIDRALAAFDAPELRTRPLADRLLAALEAGGAAGGDRRCDQQTALSAYLAVAKPTDNPRTPYIRVIVPGQKPGSPNPVRLVRKKYDAWRQTH